MRETIHRTVVYRVDSKMSAFKFLRNKFSQKETSVTKSSTKTESKQTVFSTKTETKADGAAKKESRAFFSKVTKTESTVGPAHRANFKVKAEPEVPKKIPPAVAEKPAKKTPPVVAEKPKKKINETIEKKPEMPQERKSSLSEEKIQELHETFILFDKNRDGFISKEELGAVLFSMGQRPTVIEVQAFIRSVDTDQSGTIDFDEFVTIFSAKMSIDPETELHEVFCIFDKNSDGFICAEELYSMLVQLGEPITKTEAQKMINEADTNRDGKVDYKEFKAILSAR